MSFRALNFRNIGIRTLRSHNNLYLVMDLDLAWTTQDLSSLKIKPNSKTGESTHN